MDKITKAMCVNIDMEVFEKLRKVAFEMRLSKSAFVNVAIVNELDRLDSKEQSGRN